MKRIFLLLTSLLFSGLLSSCSLTSEASMIAQNHPDFVKPSQSSIIGVWQSEKVSSSTPARKDLQQCSLSLLPDGHYHVHGSAAALGSPLLPGKEGGWKLVKEWSNLDPGSRPSWAIRFHPKGAKSKDDLNAFFVNGPSSPKLLFKRDSDGKTEIVKMKKVEYVLIR